MPYHSDTSVDSARHNQIDRRLNGILDYDNRNTRTEGQAALDFGSGSAAIELDIEGANLLLNGSKTSCPPNTVTLSDGNNSGLWRTDHIYATEAGNFAVAEGEPGDNRYVTHEIDDSDPTNPQITHSIVENERAGGPRPKGVDFAQGSGELLWSVLVPPGASTAADLNENHLWDRRRTAIDLLGTEAPRVPAIASKSFELPAGDWTLWPVMAHGGQTIRLWSYEVFLARWGFFQSTDFTLYLIDYEGTGGIHEDAHEGGINWGEYAIWQSSQMWQMGRGSGDGTLLDIDTGNEADAYAFVLSNDSDYDYVGPADKLAFHVRYTLDNTADL